MAAFKAIYVKFHIRSMDLHKETLINLLRDS